MQPKYWRRAWKMGRLSLLRSGATSLPSTLDAGVERWISSWRASHARPCRRPASDAAPTTSAGSGTTSPESSATSTPRSSSSRTSTGSASHGPWAMMTPTGWRSPPQRQQTLFGDPLDSDLSCVTWIRSGVMRSGVVSERPMLAPRIDDSASGSSDGAEAWPTATVADPRSSARHTTTTGVMHPGTMLLDAVRAWPTPKVSDAMRGTSAKRDDGTRANLGDAVANRWPTPVASDSKQWPTPLAHTKGPGGEGNREGGPNLQSVAQKWFPTPTAQSYGSSQNGINGKGGANERPSAGTPSLMTLAASGSLPSLPAPETATDGSASSPSSLSLSPLFVEMLMGVPLGWSSTAPLASIDSERWGTRCAFLLQRLLSRCSWSGRSRRTEP